MIALLLFILMFYNSCIKVEAVMGGDFVQIRDYPYFATLGDDSIGNYCGGAILSEYWVITAAHCILIDANNDTKISYGGSTSSPHTVNDIEKIIVHGAYEDFDNGFMDNDIALIKLRTPISFNMFQQPIKIKCNVPEPGDIAVVSGLGVQGNARGTTDVLKSTKLEVIPCMGESSNFFCAQVEGTVSCPGDSGGPVVIDGELAGLVSHGTVCNPTPYDGIDVYTLLYNYRDWIAKHTGVHC